MSSVGPDIYDGDESDTHDSDLLANLRNSLASDAPQPAPSAAPVAAAAVRPKPVRDTITAGGTTVIHIAADSEDSVDDLTGLTTEAERRSRQHAAAVEAERRRAEVQSDDEEAGILYVVSLTLLSIYILFS